MTKKLKSQLVFCHKKEFLCTTVFSIFFAATDHEGSSNALLENWSHTLLLHKVTRTRTKCTGVTTASPRATLLLGPDFTYLLCSSSYLLYKNRVLQAQNLHSILYIKYEVADVRNYALIFYSIKMSTVNVHTKSVLNEMSILKVSLMKCPH